MITSKIKFLAVIAGLLLFSGAAMATTITNLDGTFSNFGGIDWRQNGTAVVDGFIPTQVNSTFDLSFYAIGGDVVEPGGDPIFSTVGKSYEYTIFATMNETSTCTTFVDGICTEADFAINSGSFTIYYDVSKDANMVTGLGITDGVSIIEGTIFAQAGGGFDVVTGGNATLQALVTYTNPLYINPDLMASTATTTLQIGDNVTNWLAPTFMPAAGGLNQNLPLGYLALQADANQDFAPVPEPGTLVLLGLGLTGLAVVARRRK